MLITSGKKINQGARGCRDLCNVLIGTTLRGIPSSNVGRHCVGSIKVTDVNGNRPIELQLPSYVERSEHQHDTSAFGHSLISTFEEDIPMATQVTHKCV